MDEANATAVIWRRLAYMLTPQLDIYQSIRKIAVGKRVLEIGFGTGLGVVQYADVAEYVDAVEIDEKAFRFARKVMPIRNVHWIVDDITNPGRNYRGYDLVIMIEVLEHIENRAKAMRIFEQAMRAYSGHGILTVPNGNRYRKRHEGLNLREWTPKEFMTLLEKYFNRAYLLDSTLNLNGDTATRESPLIGGVNRGR